MKVKVCSKQDEEDKSYRRVYLKLEASPEEKQLVYEISNYLSKVNDTYPYALTVIDVVGNTNALGSMIKHSWDANLFFDPEKGTPVPKALVTEQALNELSEAVTKFLAQILSIAIDIPEVDEFVAEIDTPSNVKRELSRRGISSAYKGVIRVVKNRGFNDLKMVLQVEEPDRIKNVMKLLRLYFNVSCMGARMDLCDSTILGVSVIPAIEWFTIDDTSYYPKFEYDAMIRNSVNYIKDTINKQIKAMKESGAFNFLVASAYKPLHLEATYGINTELLKEPIRILADVRIERTWLLNNVRVNVLLDNLKKSIVNDKKQLAIGPFKGEKLENIMIYFDRDRFGFRSFGNNFTNAEVIEERYRRVLSGDFSVIDEVEKSDKEILDTFIADLKKTVLRYDTSHRENELESTTYDVYEFIPNEQKTKIMPYLVAERLKNSVEA
jgi:hypothetical protein